MSATVVFPVLSYGPHPVRAAAMEGRFWLCAADICKALGISWNGSTLKRTPEAQVRLATLGRLSGHRPVRLVSPAAARDLAARGAEGERLAAWLDREALPALRAATRDRNRPRPGEGQTHAAFSQDDQLRGKVSELRSRILSVKEAATEVYSLANERIHTINRQPRQFACSRHALVCKAYDTMNTLHSSLDCTADAIMKNAQIIDLAVSLYKSKR